MPDAKRKDWRGHRIYLWPNVLSLIVGTSLFGPLRRRVRRSSPKSETEPAANREIEISTGSETELAADREMELPVNNEMELSADREMEFLH